MLSVIFTRPGHLQSLGWNYASFFQRTYGAASTLTPNGASASRITFSSPTATTAVRVAGKYFRPAPSTSALVIAPTLFPYSPISSGGNPRIHSRDNSPATDARACNRIASVPTRNRFAFVSSSSVGLVVAIRFNSYVISLKLAPVTSFRTSARVISTPEPRYVLCDAPGEYV